MYEKDKMLKSVLSEKEQETNRVVVYKIPIIGITLLYTMAFLMFVDLGALNDGFISTVKENFYYSVFLLLFPWIILHIPLLTWHANLPNPKYISWDEKGMYIINQRDKEEFIPWGKVISVKWVGEYGGVHDEYPDYVMEIKGEGRKRNVSEDIGKELKVYFENIKDEVEPIEVPFYTEPWFKVLVWMIIASICSIALGYYIMFVA